MTLPVEYTELFRSGSKPREIREAWPSMHELVELLEGQVHRIERRYNGICTIRFYLPIQPPKV